LRYPFNGSACWPIIQKVRSYLVAGSLRLDEPRISVLFNLSPVCVRGYVLFQLSFTVLVRFRSFYFCTLGVGPLFSVGSPTYLSRCHRGSRFRASLPCRKRWVGSGAGGSLATTAPASSGYSAATKMFQLTATTFSFWFPISTLLRTPFSPKGRPTCTSSERRQERLSTAPHPVKGGSVGPERRFLGYTFPERRVRTGLVTP